MPDETPTKESEKKTKDLQIEYGFPSESVPTFYINNVHVTGSALELRFDLNEVIDRNAEENKLLVTPRARVYFAWPFVHKVIEVLQTQVDRVAQLQDQNSRESESDDEEAAEK
jgi:hypothetical protein